MTLPASSRPPRVIHIVENLANGAVENWLVRMFRFAVQRGEALDWTFFCALGEPGRLDDQVREAGGRIVYSKAPLGQARAFFAGLRRELASGGYQVMHAHHDIVSGVYMAASMGLGIPRRIVHVHNADENVPTPNPLKAALLRPPLRRLGLGADRVVGISNHTLDTFLAGRRRRPGRDRVHYYGVDPKPFLPERRADRAAFRAGLGLPADALILLFGGRVTPEKNPVMTIDILAALRRLDPRAVAVFAGAGSLEAAVVERASALDVLDHIRMLGWRQDLPAIMSAADIFVLPRPETPMEGFGLAVVEAQLAGLRLLISKGIPDDPLLSTALFRRLGLTESPEAWAQAALQLLGTPTPPIPEIFRAFGQSAMDMDRALDDLLSLHR